MNIVILNTVFVRESNARTLLYRVASSPRQRNDILGDEPIFFAALASNDTLAVGMVVVHRNALARGNE